MLPFKILKKLSDESFSEIKNNCNELKRLNGDHLVDIYGTFCIPFRTDIQSHTILMDNIKKVLKKEYGLTLNPCTMTIFVAKPFQVDNFHRDRGSRGKYPIKKSAINILLTRRDNQGFQYKDSKDSETYVEYNLEAPIIFSPSELWHNWYNNNDEQREVLSIRFYDSFNSLEQDILK